MLSVEFLSTYIVEKFNTKNLNELAEVLTIVINIEFSNKQEL